MRLKRQNTPDKVYSTCFCMLTVANVSYMSARPQYSPGVLKTCDLSEYTSSQPWHQEFSFRDQIYFLKENTRYRKREWNICGRIWEEGREANEFNNFRTIFEIPASPHMTRSYLMCYRCQTQHKAGSSGDVILPTKEESSSWRRVNL